MPVSGPLAVSDRRPAAPAGDAFACLLDERGRVLHVNAVGLTSGESTADVVGRPLSQTPWWAGRDDVRRQLDSLVDEALLGRTVVDQVVLLDAQGRARPVEVRLQPVCTDGATRVVVVSGRPMQG